MVGPSDLDWDVRLKPSPLRSARTVTFLSLEVATGSPFSIGASAQLGGFSKVIAVQFAPSTSAKTVVSPYQSPRIAPFAFGR
jgi:hypothetical protein